MRFRIKPESVSAYIEFHHINFVENAPQIANVFRHTIPYPTLGGLYILGELTFQPCDVFALQASTNGGRNKSIYHFDSGFNWLHSNAFTYFAMNPMTITRYPRPKMNQNMMNTS